MNVRTIAALVVVGIVATGCGDDGESNVSSAPSTEPASTAAPTGASSSAATSDAKPALFTDDFLDDANAWGIVDDPKFGSAKFENGDYVWDFRGSVAHWLPGVLGDQLDAGELEMLNVVVSADLTILAGGGVAGVFCRENPDSDAEWQWYEFVVRDGYAAIRHGDAEGNLEALAETKDISLPAGEPISLEATCQNDASETAQLSFAVNGAPILAAQVTDDPLTNGVPGLQAWTFPLHDPMDIVWHNFSVTATD